MGVPSGNRTTNPGNVNALLCLDRGALTLGPRPRARAHLHTKVRNGLASVSTPSVFQHGTGPWPRHTWERCAVAKVQMLMRWHAHTHGYATWAGWRSPCATSKSKKPALREDRILKERLQISSKVRKVPIVFSVMISVLFSLLFSIVVMAARTLGDDVFIVLRRDDVCMKEQSCPGHGLWEQCDHGPSGGNGGGGNRAESSSSTEQANGTSVSAP